MFYHQKVARMRVFADIQNFALRAWHSPGYTVLKECIAQSSRAGERVAQRGDSSSVP